MRILLIGLLVFSAMEVIPKLRRRLARGAFLVGDHCLQPHLPRSVLYSGPVSESTAPLTWRPARLITEWQLAQGGEVELQALSIEMNIKEVDPGFRVLHD